MPATLVATLKPSRHLTNTTHQGGPLPTASIPWTFLRLWILGSTYLSFCGWVLAAVGHLDATGYATAFLFGIAMLVWASRERLGEIVRSVRLPFTHRRWRRSLPRVFLLLLLLVGIGAALYAPNNYDALTYRVPQILHWIAEGRWHWILVTDRAINISAPGCGWLMAPSIIFFKTDRLFALPNVVAFALLPGLFFSAARGCGVRGRVAWMWMWLVPVMSCFAAQAGGIGNDLLTGAYALAALAFGLRARRLESWPDFCLSALAAALITGVKITAAPLALPWLMATLPCWPMVRRHFLSAILTTAVALTISYVPTAIINSHFTGSWTGDPDDHFHLQIHSPAHGVVGNSLMILNAALEPSLCPFADRAKAVFHAFRETGFSHWISTGFPRFDLFWGEMATEESSGVGLAIFLLAVLSTAVGLLRCHRSPLPARVRWVHLAILLAFGAFLAKMGSEASARLASPYYPFLLIVLLAVAGQEWATRQGWWRPLATLVALSIVPALILSPARPLWPAQSVLHSLAQNKPDNKAIRRALTVYSVYGQRHDYLAPLKAQLPADTHVLGVIPTENDIEGTLWKPYGSRKVVEVLTASPADPALASLRGSTIITSKRALRERFNLTPEAYASSIGGTISARAMLTQKVGLGLEEWVLISLAGRTAFETSRDLSPETK